MRTPEYIAMPITTLQITKKGWLLSSLSWLVVLLLVLFMTGCGPSPKDRERGDEIKAEIKILNYQQDSIGYLLEEKRKELAQINQGSSSSSILLLLLLGIGLAVGAAFAYKYRRRLARKWNQLVSTESNTDEPLKTSASTSSPQEPAQTKRGTPPQKEQPTTFTNPAPSTPPAPAAAPPEMPPVETEGPDNAIELEVTRYALPPVDAPEMANEFRYAYSPVDGTFDTFGEDEVDEHTSFKITVNADGNTASFVVADNLRQKQNILDNRAAFAEAVQYSGNPGSYGSAKITPGTLRREGNRWRIVERITIEQ